MDEPTTAPAVSVLMPVYNGARFVDRAVESVRSQTVDGWELLMVDDGSSDGSLALAQRWASLDPRIRVLQHPGGVNRGVSASRNLAAAHARAPWLALLDADDEWEPSKLELQLRVSREHPALALVYSRAQVVDEAGEPVEIPLELQEEIPPIRGTGIPGEAVDGLELSLTGRLPLDIPASSTFFPALLFHDAGGFDEGLDHQVEDTILLFQLMERGPVYFQPELLVNYRLHDSQWMAGIRADASRHLKGMRITWLAFLERARPENREAVARATVARGFRSIVARGLRFPRFELGAVLDARRWMVASPHLGWGHRWRMTALLVVYILAYPLRPLFRGRE
ncbi:MAG: glycosyltransferase family 2 protein [Gemmatimonadota bacterium]